MGRYPSSITTQDSAGTSNSLFMTLRRYFDFIKYPLAFSDMRERLQRRQYRTWGAFVDDFELVCANALAFNRKRSRVHRAAVTLQHAGRLLLQVKGTCRLPFASYCQKRSHLHRAAGSLQHGRRLLLQVQGSAAIGLWNRSPFQIKSCCEYASL